MQATALSPEIFPELAHVSLPAGYLPLSQNGWDTLGSPCPLNVVVQDLVTEPQ